MLGVDTGGQGGGESEEDVRAFIEQTLVTFPIVWDLTPPTMKQFAFPPAISPYPRQVVIGKDGKVVYLNSEYDEDALRAAIVVALAG